MRILNDEDDKSLKLVSVLLTKDEALQMVGYLEDLIQGNTDHAHVMSDDYSKEITLSLYDQKNFKV